MTKHRPVDAETPQPGSWADPHGPGRCARCASWLSEGACVITATPRRGDRSRASAQLCWDCTREVFNAWRAWLPTHSEDIRQEWC